MEEAITYVGLDVRKETISVALGRLGRSEEVAGVCLFLASELSSFVTGSVIDANGRLLIH